MIWWYLVVRFFSSLLMVNGVIFGLIILVSSLEMFISVLSRFLMFFSELLTLCTSGVQLDRFFFFSSALVNSCVALSGCSRLWLTVVRNLVLDRLVCLVSFLVSCRRAFICVCSLILWCSWSLIVVSLVVRSRTCCFRCW